MVLLGCSECDGVEIKLVNYEYKVSGEEGVGTQFVESYKCLTCGHDMIVVDGEQRD